MKNTIVLSIRKKLWVWEYHFIVVNSRKEWYYTCNFLYWIWGDGESINKCINKFCTKYKWGKGDISTVHCKNRLKVHEHEIFCLTFFAETQTLWSQGPVTRDFWKSYSIRPRYSTFKHFRACSACDEIGSSYDQHAMKFVPRMLSVR